MEALNLLAQVEAWHWLAVMFALIAFEALGVGGFFMGMTAAALVAAVLNWLGFSWQLQFVAFGALSILFSWLYWAKFRHFNEKRDGNEQLNDRFSHMLGKHGKVIDLKAPGLIKAQFGDTLWVCQTSEALALGDLVEVCGHEDSQLIVKKSV